MAKIQQHFANWMDTIKLHNAMGLTDINTDVKNVCCGLMSIVLDMQFQNLNLLKQNYHVIDLADSPRRICVKVTSTADSSKISSTLRRFFDYGIDNDFDRLIILILGEKKNYRKAFPQKEGFSFDPQRDIWDFPRLLSEIDVLDISKLHQVEAYLQEQLGDPGSSISPVQNRSALLDRIQRVLKEYADTIKTNISSRRADILVDSETIFRDLLNMVYKFKLVLANPDTLNTPAVNLIDKDNGVAVQISSLNTRNKVQHTCNQFLAHGFDKSYKTLFVLILAYAPPFRSADLLFAQLREKGVDLQIKTLWDLTREIGALPLDLITEIAEFLDQNIGTNTPQKQDDDASIPLPSMKVDDLTDILRQTFRLATLLPPAGLERTVLEHGLTLEQKHALVDLIHHGFLLKEDSVIRMHPAFQNNRDYSPSQGECSFLLERLWYFEDNHRWDRFTLRTKTHVTNSLAQLFSMASGLFPSCPTYAQHSAELWRKVQHYTDALNLGQKALSGFRSIKNESWDVARTLHFTGECHIELNHPELALVDWEQTLELCQNPLCASAPDLATAYQSVGIALLEQKKHHAAKAYLLRSLKIMEALRRESQDFLMLPWMEVLYNSLSAVCTALANTQHAMLCTQNTILPPRRAERPLGNSDPASSYSTCSKRQRFCWARHGGLRN